MRKIIVVIDKHKTGAFKFLPFPNDPLSLSTDKVNIMETWDTFTRTVSMSSSGICLLICYGIVMTPLQMQALSITVKLINHICGTISLS